MKKAVCAFGLILGLALNLSACRQGEILRDPDTSDESSYSGSGTTTKLAMESAMESASETTDETTGESTTESTINDTPAESEETTNTDTVTTIVSNKTTTKAPVKTTTKVTTKATTKATVKSTTKSTTKVTTTTTTKAPTTQSKMDTEAIATKIIELINVERAKLGLKKVTTAPIAHEIALTRANELLVKYSHTRPNGTGSGSIFTEYKYGICTDYTKIPGMEKYGVVYEPVPGTEDICTCNGWVYKETVQTSAQDIVDTFKSSAGHWDDLMGAEYTGIGVGVALRYGADKSFAGGCAIEMMDKTYG